MEEASHKGGEQSRIREGGRRGRGGLSGPRRQALDSRRPGADDVSMTTLQQAEAADHAAIEELDRLVIVKSTIYTSGERDPREPPPRQPDQGKLYLMGHDPRLPRMPARPTLFDFF